MVLFSFWFAAKINSAHTSFLGLWFRYNKSTFGKSILFHTLTGEHVCIRVSLGVVYLYVCLCYRTFLQESN